MTNDDLIALLMDTAGGNDAHYAAMAAAAIRELEELLREAREDWIKVGYGASHEDVAACRDICDRIDAFLGPRPQGTG